MSDVDTTPTQYSVIIHQLTAPRTIQAILALVFSSLIVVEVWRGNEPSDLLMIVVSALLGFYFSDVSNPLSGLTNGQSSRIVEAVAQRVEQDLAHEKPLPRSVPIVNEKTSPFESREAGPQSGEGGAP